MTTDTITDIMSKTDARRSPIYGKRARPPRYARSPNKRRTVLKPLRTEPVEYRLPHSLLCHNIQLRAFFFLILFVLFCNDAHTVETPHFFREHLPNHAYTGGWEFFVGGGVAVFDCNDDYYPELYMAGGSGNSSFFLNQSRRGDTIKFSKIDSSPAIMRGVTGAYPIDIDNDARTDLVVLRLGKNFIFKGLGNCQFENAGDQWGIDGGNAWTTAFSAVWEAGNDFPTLAFGNYVDRNKPGAPFGTCHDNALYRPSKHNRYLRPEKPGTGYCALSMLYSDWNRDGIPDLRISNDRQYYIGGKEQLYRHEPGLSPREYSLKDGWRDLKIWGMGIASHDVTETGYPDYFLTSMADNKFQTLSAQNAFGDLKPMYEDKAGFYNITAHRPYVKEEIFPSTAWHAEFSDVNNDGFADLFIAKGNVGSMPDFAKKDPNNLLLGAGVDKPYVEAGRESGIMTFSSSRGASLADLNLDGLPDIIVVNREESAALYRNTGGGKKTGKSKKMGSWLGVKLLQDNFNRYAVGAWVEVKIGARIIRLENTVGGGHAGGKSGFLHFGTGTAELSTVRVHWPSGDWSHWYKIINNQYAVIEKNNPNPQYLYPPESATLCKTAQC